MATKNQIISDIELRLTRGKPSDDLELSRRQIAFWMDTYRDIFVKDLLNDAVKKKQPINPYYLIDESCKLATEEILGCEQCKNRFYLLLEKDVMPLMYNKGVFRVEDNRNVALKGFEKEDIEMLYNLRFSRPNQRNQVYYREGRKIFIEEVDEKIADIANYRVWYIPANYADTLSGDDEYPIDGDSLPEFIDYIEQIGIRQMYGEFEDLNNDGQQA